MPPAHTPALAPAKRPRDVRLDFFRGCCLIIIYIAHVWDNPWAHFIPARFGFSDATEIFVFCSGMASAVAFGSVFERHGMMMGVARIAHRCWQVYWCHIGTFLAAVAVMAAADLWPATGGGYLDGANIGAALTTHGREVLLGLVTLTYVPNYFDILPMYMIILAMIPVVVALVRFDRTAAALAIVAVWLIASSGRLDLPAEPWSVGTTSGRTWFFNPFSWQLVFFTGFAFMRGWLPAPPLDRRLVAAAAVILALSAPLAWYPALQWSETLAGWSSALAPLTDKTHFGLLRYVHFLALAYLAYAAAGENGVRLRGPAAEWLRRLGQQSLAVFMTGLVLSFAASVLLNMIGRGFWAVALVNAGGIAMLFGVSRAVAWFKSSPWQRPHQHGKQEPKDTGAASSRVVAKAAKTSQHRASVRPAPLR